MSISPTGDEEGRIQDAPSQARPAALQPLPKSSRGGGGCWFICKPLGSSSCSGAITRGRKNFARNQSRFPTIPGV